jgi:tetratricopeptide (TPR) repeat protein
MEGDYQIIRLKIFISTQQYQIACELIRRWDAVPKVHPELEVVMKRLQEQAIRLHREALDRLASDQHRGALELLDEAVSISPSSLAIRRDRSRVLRHLEMYQRSLDDMLWIYETEKQNEGARAARTFEDRDLLLEIASLWESLGHSLMKSAAEEVDKRAERQEEALACFRRALGSQPDNADYIKNVAGNLMPNSHYHNY